MSNPPPKTAAAKPNVWESDPTSDIQQLFSQLDSKFFQDKMKKNGVLLEWSEKANSTAGYSYQLNDDVRKTKRVYIVLNKPLLRLRSRIDVVETLLHEMIHALLYTAGIEENHGPNFRRIMKSINKVAGTNITVYHEFHDEVDFHKHLAGIGQERKHETHPGFVGLPNVGAPPLNPRHFPGVPVGVPPLNPSHFAGVPVGVPPLNPRNFGDLPKVPPPQPRRVPAWPAGLQPKTGDGARQSGRSRIDLMSQILKSYKGAIPDRQIKLIGYNHSDSESDFSDSDSDFEYEQKKKDFEDQKKALKKKVDDAREQREQRERMMLKHKELFNIKEDLKAWLSSTIYSCPR